MQLPITIHNRADGPTVSVTPLQGMTCENTALRASNRCDQTMLLIHKQGAVADPKKVQKSLTRKTHIIRTKKKDVILGLDPSDMFVAGAVASAAAKHGQCVTNLTTSSHVMAFKFDRPVEAKVVEVPATRGHTLPGIYDLLPESHTSKEDGITQFVFHLKWSDVDNVELNICDSDDSG